ncbi:Gfo/Idh/MocA family oxidoreductase [Streptomyces brasiliscabiei]|uniref:Gfo/Idh/MocA family oxidoreductase n=1 Tax=Streptomyces brasiliscabiei TaxID=2736302 RepID=A0ABU8G7P3_9ACTN
MVNLRAAVVGCGRSASAAHASAHTAEPRVHLAAVVDPDRGRARALARRFGVREVFTSLEELLATTDVDLVSICAPPPLHVPLAATALRAGCHVLCEPSAATGAADLARLAALATTEHRVLTYAFPYRHLTEIRTARRIVDAGEIGEIHEIQLVAPGRREAADEECWAGWAEWAEGGGGGGGLRPLGAPDAVGAADGPDGRLWTAENADRVSWVTDEEVRDRPRAAAGTRHRHLGPADCGPLTGTGMHLLDLAMWITGFPEPVEMLWTTPDPPPAAVAYADGRTAQPRAAQARALGRGSGAQQGTDAADARAARAVAARARPDAAPVPPAERPATGLVAAPGTGPLGPGRTALIRCRDGMSLSLTASHGTAQSTGYAGGHGTAYATAQDTAHATSRGTAYTADPPDEETVRVRLVGDRGALEIFPLLLSHPNGTAPGHTVPPLPGKPHDLPLARSRQLTAFVDACLGRGPAPVTTAQLVHMQKIADGLHRSAHATTAPGEPDTRDRSTVPGRTDSHEAIPVTVDDPVQEASRA